jgi:CxxC motif-containing protein (DUF1111 family)
MRTTRATLALAPLVAAVLAWAIGMPTWAAGDSRDSRGSSNRDDSNQAGQFGKPLDGLTAEQLRLFNDGKDGFEEEEEDDEGLGPIFNDVGCAACHFVPAIGGSSEISETRAARADGGVYHDVPGGSLFQNKSVTAECIEHVPGKANIRAKRQTQPLFGSGLIEAIPDSQIREYAELQAATHPDQAGRIHVVLDVASGEKRVGRFGWKSQQATLMAFSGDAYLNEMGITTPMFPDENAPNDDPDKLAECDEVADPEDDGEDLIFFTNFMRLLAPPPKGPETSRTAQGRQIFQQIGCAVCHHAGYSAASPIGAINGKRVEAFSDLLLHDAGTGDGIIQGDAQQNELRTAPLWGVGSSAPYLHDGTARTIDRAILRHGNQAGPARNAFEALSAEDKQRLLDFLGSI